MLCLHVVTVKDCICMLLALFSSLQLIYRGMHNMDELNQEVFTFTKNKNFQQNILDKSVL